MLSHFKTLTLCVTVVVGLLPAQEADGPIEKRGGYWYQEVSGSMAQPIRLTVNTVGDVRIQGGNTDRVEYRIVRKTKAASEEEAKALFDRARPATSRRGPSATLTLEDPACSRCGFRSAIEITAPRALRETVVRTAKGFKQARKLGDDVSGLNDWNVRWVGPEGYKGIVARQLQEFKAMHQEPGA